MKLGVNLPCLLVTLLIVLSHHLPGQELPTGFIQTQLVDELDPTSMSIAPDGRIFITEKNGKIRLVIDGNLQAAPFLTIKVDNFNERGLSGLTFDPNFEANSYFYVYYTVPDNNRNRLSRFTANGNTTIPNSEKILIEFEPLAGAIHNGGGMAFGKDGKLYIAVGDGSNGSLAQNLSSTSGKVLRINADGSIPEDNPFMVPRTTQKSPVWALGFRNPFTFAIDTVSGKLFVNDVGNSLWEEINEVGRGTNHGWPLIEGLRHNEVQPNNYRDPLHAYSHQEGCAIVGGAFFNPTTTTFPDKYKGKYFFGEYCQAQIRLLNTATGKVEETFLTGTQRPVSIRLGPDGNLYYLTRGANRGGSVYDNTSAGDGQLWKIEYRGNGSPIVSIQPKSTLVAIHEDAFFTTGASGDATLKYQWYKENQLLPGATDAILRVLNAQLADDGSKYYCEISNDKGKVVTRSATLTVTPNTRPTILFSAPSPVQRFSAGDTIYYKASATDLEDGLIDPSSLQWKIDFHHDDHVHPAIGSEEAALKNYFVVPRSGETAVTVYYRIYCTAKDKEGLAKTEFINVLPRRTSFSVQTLPAGIEVNIDGSNTPAPIEVNSVLGILRVITAPKAVFQGTKILHFKRWKEINSDQPLVTFFAGEIPSLTAEYTEESLNIGKGNGLRALYFQGDADSLLNDKIYDAQPVLIRIDTTVNFNWGIGSPALGKISDDNFAVRWLGELEPIFTEDHYFHLSSDDGIRLWIGDKLIVDNWNYHPVTEAISQPIRLEVGKRYHLKMEFFEGSGEAEVRLWWSTPVSDSAPVPKSQLFSDPTPLNVLNSFKFTYQFAPQPMEEKVNLSIRSTVNEKLHLRLHDASGRMVFEQMLDIRVGTNLHEINIANLTPGVYFAQFLDGRNAYEAVKLVKVK